MKNNEYNKYKILNSNKTNQIIMFVALFCVGVLSITQIYYNKLDFIDSFFLFISLIFSAATLPIIFMKITFNLPKIEINNGMIEYKNVFQSYKFIVKESQIYFEKKYLLDFLVIRDNCKSVYILTSELNEDFYQKLFGVKNRY